MLVYTSTKSGFIDDVKEDCIDEKILASFKRHTGRSVADNEVKSWRESMRAMGDVLEDDQIPPDAGVAIEFNLPKSLKRIDFILSGKGENDKPAIVIVELKQWQHVETTTMDGIVRTFLGGAKREVPHPSYQAWSYATFLKDFSEVVQNEGVELRPCAYLHNCLSPDEVRSNFYDEHTEKAPLFIRKERKRLAEFIKRYVKYGDNCETMYRIDDGRVRPSRDLADALASTLSGNPEFALIDEQKLVFETAVSLALRATVKERHVLVIEGGPGTGKSVIAINLLARLTKEDLVAHYVSKNSAPRAVYLAKLTGSRLRGRFNNMAKGSGSYIDAENAGIDALIVDEAHRLTAQSGFFGNEGENQIKEIILASKFSIFFVDASQRVTLKDIGTVESISKWAHELGATLHYQELQSQFRCNGADGYLAWLDNVLEIRKTANETLDGVDYDFRVFDSPADLMAAIVERNTPSNRARLVAGYCWEWTSKTDPRAFDIELPEHGFKMRWNLKDESELWIIKPDSVNEIGCIHTCQGLETDYVGVIIGPDLTVRNGHIETDGTKRAKNDKSIKGFKQLLKADPNAAKAQAELIIKNTYRTLMTRGMKGCYVFCTDRETNNWLKSAMGRRDADSAMSFMKEGSVSGYSLSESDRKVAEEGAYYTSASSDDSSSSN